MDIKFLTELQEIIKGHTEHIEIEFTLDDGNIFTSSDFVFESYGDSTLIAVETTSSPSEYVFFPLYRIHHIVLKSRHKKKISFRLEDLPSLSKTQEPPKQISESKDESKDK